MISRKLKVLSLILFLFVFGMTANIFAQAKVDTVAGWCGPTDCDDDSGHIAVLDSFGNLLPTQGQKFMEFTVHYVNSYDSLNNPDSLGFCFFKKIFDFGGRPRPDLIEFDLAADTLSNQNTRVSFVICYKDTMWHPLGSFGPDPYQIQWDHWALDSSQFAYGYYLPGWTNSGPAPTRIDSLMLVIWHYNLIIFPPDSGKKSAYIFMDNLIFRYIIAPGDTVDSLIDGMGDPPGIEESKQRPSTDILYISTSPNPFSTQMEITFSGQVIKDIKDISIFDFTGRKIRGFPPKKCIIWKDDSPAGIYFILVKTPKKSFIRKLIKLR